jgi:hypothetical protein
MSTKNLLILLLVMFSLNSHSKTIANCGGSTGKSYFVAGSVVPEEQAGMQDDKLSSGKIKLELIDDDFRLLTVDASGEIKTIEGEGGKQVFLPTGTGISILGIYESVFEHYLFRPSEGIVTWSSARAGSIIDKHSLFTSKCEFYLDNL